MVMYMVTLSVCCYNTIWTVVRVTQCPVHTDRPICSYGQDWDPHCLRLVGLQYLPMCRICGIFDYSCIHPWYACLVVYPIPWYFCCLICMSVYYNYFLFHFFRSRRSWQHQSWTDIVFYFLCWGGSQTVWFHISGTCVSAICRGAVLDLWSSEHWAHIHRSWTNRTFSLPCPSCIGSDTCVYHQRFIQRV